MGEDTNAAQAEEFASVSEGQRKQLKEIGQQLANICHKLHISGDDGAQTLYNAAEYVKSRTPRGYIQTPLLDGHTANKFQYGIISEINDDFKNSYTARKQMLRVRFEALLDSMKKSDKINEDQMGEIESKTSALMEGLENPADIETRAAFGAQEDLFLDYKINYSLKPNIIRPFVM